MNHKGISLDKLNKSISIFIIVTCVFITYTTITEIQDRNTFSEILSTKAQQINESYKRRYSDLASFIEKEPIYDDNHYDDKYLARRYRETFKIEQNQKNDFGDIEKIDTHMAILKTLRDVGLSIKFKKNKSDEEISDPLLYLYISSIGDKTIDRNVKFTRLTLPYLPLLSDSKLFFISLVLSGLIGSMFRYATSNENELPTSLIAGLAIGFAVNLTLKSGIHLIFSDPKIGLINFNVYTNSLLALVISYFHTETIQFIKNKARILIEKNRQ